MKSNKTNRYLLKSEKETMQRFQEIAKMNDFPMSRYINDCIEQYLKSYDNDGFKDEVSIKVPIRKFERINK